MYRYKVISPLGDGTYGSVLKAIHSITGEVVAVKKMKRPYRKWDDCVSLREVRSLRKISHPNVIKLKEIIKESDQLFFVFEYMDCNLYEFMKDREKLFPEAVVRNIIYQVLQGLYFMHGCGYFHRDLKPENILVKNGQTCKLADFGLARQIRSHPPYTDYVSTRWYRAPEVLLRSTSYNSPIDIWAVGAIIAELFALKPIFPGSTETDEIIRICNILGAPTKETWPEGVKLAAIMNFRFPNKEPTLLDRFFPVVSPDGVDFMKRCFAYEPTKRPTALQALLHPFFRRLPVSGPVFDQNVFAISNAYSEFVFRVHCEEVLPLLSPRNRFPATESPRSNSKNIYLRNARYVPGVTFDGNRRDSKIIFSRKTPSVMGGRPPIVSSERQKRPFYPFETEESANIFGSSGKVAIGNTSSNQLLSKRNALRTKRTRTKRSSSEQPVTITTTKGTAQNKTVTESHNAPTFTDK